LISPPEYDADANEIDELGREFASGNKNALISAMYMCVKYGHPFPSWAVAAFIEAYERVEFNFEHRSWDEVFGRPSSKGRKLQAIKQRDQIAWEVYRRVRDLRARRPKPRDIFETVGCEFKISTATAKRYFDDCAAWRDYAIDRLQLEKFAEARKHVLQWAAELRSIESLAIELGNPTLSDAAVAAAVAGEETELSQIASGLERMADKIVRLADDQRPAPPGYPPGGVVQIEEEEDSSENSENNEPDMGG
jgi:hypothetical protein